MKVKYAGNKSSSEIRNFPVLCVHVAGPTITREQFTNSLNKWQTRVDRKFGIRWPNLGKRTGRISWRDFEPTNGVGSAATFWI